MAETLANNAQGNLNANITSGDTSLVLQAGQGAKFPSTGNFRILIESELILVGARSGDTLSSLTRGAESTTAAAHNSPAVVTHILTAAGLTAFTIQPTIVDVKGDLIAATAADAVARLAVGSNDQLLTADSAQSTGLKWAGLNLGQMPAAFARVYARATTTVDVANTTTETSLFSQSITGNDMSTNKMLRLMLIGDYLFNNNVANTIIFKIKFGGTTFYQSNASTLTGAIGAGRQPWRLDVVVANLGATNSQMIEAQGFATAPNTPAPTTGIGQLVPANHCVHYAGITTLGTIDTTTAQTLDITATWSAASANNSWRMRYGCLELV